MALFQSLAVTAALKGKRCAFGVHTTVSDDDDVDTAVSIIYDEDSTNDEFTAVSTLATTASRTATRVAGASLV